MKMQTICTVMLGCMVAAAGAQARAQQQQSAPMDDATFVQQASLSDYNEIMFSNLALTNSKSGKVKDFATRMIADHNQLETAMAPFAKKLGVAPANSMDPDHAAKYQQLQEMKGEEFDKMYMQGMDQDHHMALSLFQNELSSGGPQTKGMKRVVEHGQKVIQHHTEMADKLAGEVGASTTAVAPAM